MEDASRSNLYRGVGHGQEMVRRNPGVTKEWQGRLWSGGRCLNLGLQLELFAALFGSWWKLYENSSDYYIVCVYVYLIM